jgi:hypothetical protein
MGNKMAENWEKLKAKDLVKDSVRDFSPKKENWMVH